MISEINLNQNNNTPETMLCNALGQLDGRVVTKQTKDAKFASLFKNAFKAIGNFFVSSVKFTCKVVLFITGISPLYALTKYFLKRLNSKQQHQAAQELPTKAHVEEKTLVQNIKDPTTSETNTEEEKPALRRSTRVRKQPEYYGWNTKTIEQQMQQIQQEHQAEPVVKQEKLQAANESSAPQTSVENVTQKEKTTKKKPKPISDAPQTELRRSTRERKPPVRLGFS